MRINKGKEKEDKIYVHAWMLHRGRGGLGAATNATSTHASRVYWCSTLQPSDHWIRMTHKTEVLYHK